MFKSTRRASPVLCLIVGGAILNAWAAPKSQWEALRGIRTVYPRRSSGNAYFNSQLRSQLQRDGLRFVSRPRDADAILDSSGNYQGRAFRGQMTFFDRRGNVIWKRSVVRGENSRVMAFRQLADAVRAERKPRR